MRHDPSPAGFRTAMVLFLARLAGFHSLIALGIVAVLIAMAFFISPTARYVVTLQAPTEAVVEWVSGTARESALVFRADPDSSWREASCTYLSGGVANAAGPVTVGATRRPELELDCLVTYASVRRSLAMDSADWFSALQHGPGYGMRNTKSVFMPDDMSLGVVFALLIHAVLALGLLFGWRSGVRGAFAGWKQVLQVSVAKGWLFVPILAGAAIATGLSSLGVSPGPPLPAMQGWMLATFLLAALVVAPWVEEFFFRGWMVDSLRQCVPAWLAMLASANAFALMHVPSSLAVWGYYLVVGLSFSWLRSRSGSLVPCVIAHSLYNVLATATMLLWPG